MASDRVLIYQKTEAQLSPVSIFEQREHNKWKPSRFALKPLQVRFVFWFPSTIRANQNKK